MITVRPSETRGKVSNHWITSRRSFSNNSYWNPEYINWHSVRAINDDVLQPGFTIPRHRHSNMEIFTYVVQGRMSHWESVFNSTTEFGVGTMQYISSGTGIDHTQTCTSTEPVHYLQVWVQPDEPNTAATYQTHAVCHEFSELPVPMSRSLRISAGWIQKTVAVHNCYGLVIQGEISVDDQLLHPGDAFWSESGHQVQGTGQLLLFEKI